MTLKFVEIDRIIIKKKMRWLELVYWHFSIWPTRERTGVSAAAPPPGHAAVPTLGRGGPGVKRVPWPGRGGPPPESGGPGPGLCFSPSVPPGQGKRHVSR